MFNGFKLLGLLKSGHTIGHVLHQSCNDIIIIPRRFIQIFPFVFVLAAFIFLFFVSVLLKYRKTQNKVFDFFLAFLMIFIVVIAWIRLYKTGFWAGGTFSGTRIGFGGLAFFIVIFLLDLMTYMFRDIRKLNKNSDKMFFKESVKLYVLLFFLIAAYAFGSGNGFIRQTSGAFIFLSTASLYAAFDMDRYFQKSFLGVIISLLLILSICMIMISAYKKPYRLPAPIKSQTFPVTLGGTKGTLFVDKKTARYVNDLKKIAFEDGWKPGMCLIDLTGGSPGATVILGGKFLGTPWLLGGYKGSNKYAEMFIAMASKEKQHSAWILTAPKGKLRISSKILLKLGLDFPGDYSLVGQVRTGHRNEIQYLWKPNENLSTLLFYSETNS